MWVCLFLRQKNRGVGSSRSSPIVHSTYLLFWVDKAINTLKRCPMEHILSVSISRNEDKSQFILLVALMTLSSFSFFVVFPYLALHLHIELSMSETAVGLVVGVVVLISSISAWFGGYLVDRFGAKLLLGVASVGYTLVFLGLFFTSTIGLTILLLCAIGLCRMMMEPALKSILAATSKEDGRLFKIRYLTLIAGAAFAPLIVGIVPNGSFKWLFLFAAMLQAAFFVLSRTITVPNSMSSQSEINTSPLDISLGMLFGLIMFGMLFFLVFSQLETTVSLFLNQVFYPIGVEYYRYVLITNAILAFVFLAATEKFLESTTTRPVVFVACMSMALSMWLVFSSSTLWQLLVGVALFTLGEVILFPLPDILAARVAKAGTEGRLMGLVDIRYFGFFVGPLLGSALLTASITLLTATLFVAAVGLVPISWYLLTGSAETRSTDSRSAQR